MSTTATSRASRLVGRVERHHPLQRRDRVGLGQQDALVAVEHDVPAPLAHAHQAADAVGDRRAPSPSSASASGTCAVGARRRRSAAGRSGRSAAVDLRDAHARRLVEQRAGRPPSARPPPARARSRGSRSTPPASARTRARSTAASASTRSRTAATSTSSELTGSDTKERLADRLGEVGADVAGDRDLGASGTAAASISASRRSATRLRPRGP